MWNINLFMNTFFGPHCISANTTFALIARFGLKIHFLCLTLAGGRKCCRLCLLHQSSIEALDTVHWIATLSDCIKPSYVIMNIEFFIHFATQPTLLTVVLVVVFYHFNDAVCDFSYYALHQTYPRHSITPQTIYSLSKTYLSKDMSAKLNVQNPSVFWIKLYSLGSVYSLGLLQREVWFPCDIGQVVRTFYSKLKSFVELWSLVEIFSAHCKIFNLNAWTLLCLLYWLKVSW